MLSDHQVCSVIILYQWQDKTLHDLGAYSLETGSWWIKVIRFWVCLWNSWSNCWVNMQEHQRGMAAFPAAHCQFHTLEGEQVTVGSASRVCAGLLLWYYLSLSFFSCTALPKPHPPATSTHKPLSCRFATASNLSFIEGGLLCVEVHRGLFSADGTVSVRYWNSFRWVAQGLV